MRNGSIKTNSKAKLDYLFGYDRHGRNILSHAQRSQIFDQNANERFASQDGNHLSKQTLDSIHFAESTKNSGWRVVDSIKTPTAIQCAPLFLQAV